MQKSSSKKMGKFSRLMPDRPIRLDWRCAPRHPRAAPAAATSGPRARTLAIVALDDQAAGLSELVASLAASEGFEVLPAELSATAEVRLYLRASGTDEPLAVAGRGGRLAAEIWQMATPG